ncbi:MAG TPA: glycosyltransferase family 9 protein, partial [Anseongella sp.]|nr:glycosyltransferase family 9 protein [Anseongella sp.]
TQVLMNMRNTGENLSGRFSLNGLAALLAGATVVVSNDTGPLHLARSLGIPNVGIFWAVNAVTAGAVAMSANRLCIAWNPYCPACGKDCLNGNVHEANGSCDHGHSFVTGVATEEVIGHARDLLALRRTPALREEIAV